MNWYRENGEQWRKIIDVIAHKYKKTEVMIEKDTIQSLFLYKLSTSDLPFVFKGGTSLSKVFGIIDRFSEDIDLSMSRKLTEKEKKTAHAQILEIAREIGLELTNPGNVASRYSYNKYVFEYASLFDSEPQEMIVETSYYQTVYPVLPHEVGSFVGRFCWEYGGTLPVPFEADYVQIDVQSLERTLVDKVFAVCDYRIQNMEDRDSRHLYDIYKLLPYVKLDEELTSLVDRVRVDRMKSKNNPSAQPEYNIPDMLKEMIDSRFYEPDYKQTTQRLLYEDVGYDEAVNGGIAKIAKSDVFLYRGNTDAQPVF